MSAYGIFFLHVGFSNIKKPCHTLPVKFLKFLAALIPVAPSFCSWLCLRDFLSLPKPKIWRSVTGKLSFTVSTGFSLWKLVCTQSNYWCPVALQQCFSVSACSAVSRQLRCNEERSFLIPWCIFIDLKCFPSPFCYCWVHKLICCGLWTGWWNNTAACSFGWHILVLLSSSLTQFTWVIFSWKLHTLSH